MAHKPESHLPCIIANFQSLSIYVEGGRKDDVRQILFGLSVLRHATEDQLAIAMPLVEASQHMTRTGIQEMLAR